MERLSFSYDYAKTLTWGILSDSFQKVAFAMNFIAKITPYHILRGYNTNRNWTKI